VHDKKNFLVIHALGDHELLLYTLETILSFYWILSLREGGGPSSQELNQTGLVRWRGRMCLLLVRLHIIKGLQFNLHQIVLGGDQLLDIDGVVGGVARLAIALVVPCVHHLTG
jgi:hypothetical protein